MISKDLVQMVSAAFAHPDMGRITPAGTSGDGENSFLAAPTNQVVVQRTHRKDNWAEIDLKLRDRWMRLHVFGSENQGYSCIAAVQYIRNDYQPSFDAPGWQASRDVLLMLATGSSSEQLTRRILGKEPDDTFDQSPLSPTPAMLAIANAFTEHDFITQLEQTALSRNRFGMYLLVPGDKPRYQQLLKGLFTVTKHDNATVFTRTIE